MLVAIIVAALDVFEANPSLAARVRAVLGGEHDEPIALARVAADLGVRPRVLRDAARRGELAIQGPRNARVILRSERDRWLASQRIEPKTTAANDTHDEHAEDRAAFERSAARRLAIK